MEVVTVELRLSPILYLKPNKFFSKWEAQIKEVEGKNFRLNFAFVKKVNYGEKEKYVLTKNVFTGLFAKFLYFQRGDSWYNYYQVQPLIIKKGTELIPHGSIFMITDDTCFMFNPQQHFPFSPWALKEESRIAQETRRRNQLAGYDSSFGIGPDDDTSNYDPNPPRANFNSVGLNNRGPSIYD